MTLSNPDTTTTQPPHAPAARTGLSWWQAILAGAAVATAINLVVLLIARAADASLVLRAPDADHQITAGGVVFSSVVPMTGGIILATLLALWRPVFLRVAQVVGGGIGLLTVAGPLASDTDGATRLALAAMHVVVAVIVVLALEAIRRRRQTG